MDSIFLPQVDSYLQNPLVLNLTMSFWENTVIKKMGKMAETGRVAF